VDIFWSPSLSAVSPLVAFIGRLHCQLCQLLVLSRLGSNWEPRTSSSCKIFLWNSSKLSPEDLEVFESDESSLDERGESTFMMNSNTNTINLITTTVQKHAVTSKISGAVCHSTPVRPIRRSIVLMMVFSLPFWVKYQILIGMLKLNSFKIIKLNWLICIIQW
jgi:hypothetical protein